MPRYVKQRNGFSCGPIALINVLKHFGKKVSYKNNYKQFAKVCKTNEEGTWDKDLEAVLKRFNIKFRTKTNANLRDIDKHIKNSILIFAFYPYEDEGHYAVITHKTKKYYHFINSSLTNKTVDHVDRETVQKLTKGRSTTGKRCRLSKIWYFPNT